MAKSQIGLEIQMPVERMCFICGSPDHMARDCMENSGPSYPPHPAMFGGPGNRLKQFLIFSC
jgi:hypothetical protein